MPQARVCSQGPWEAQKEVVEVVPAAEELVERGSGRCSGRERERRGEVREKERGKGGREQEAKPKPKKQNLQLASAPCVGVFSEGFLSLYRRFRGSDNMLDRSSS